MLRIAICDDERIHRRHTAELIDSALAARSADISCFDSSEALLQAVVSGYAPDIAVLDIQMGEMERDQSRKEAQCTHSVLPHTVRSRRTSHLRPKSYSTEHVYFILKSQIDEAHRKRTGEGRVGDRRGSRQRRDAAGQGSRRHGADTGEGRQIRGAAGPQDACRRRGLGAVERACSGGAAEAGMRSGLSDVIRAYGSIRSGSP